MKNHKQPGSGSLNRQIMVVDRSQLFGHDSADAFNGFAAAGKMDFYKRILANSRFIDRPDAETDTSLKQPIAYCLIIDPKRQQVFAYQRATKEGQYDEVRLRGRWSWGIGGHIDRTDSGDQDPIKASLERELEEEVHVQVGEPPQLLGYINDDKTPVGQVHFGLLFYISTSGRVEPRDAEIAFGSWKSLKELKAICRNGSIQVESWSEIALRALEKNPLF
jgi:predicted NUDIX family phosphoesterase